MPVQSGNRAKKDNCLCFKNQNQTAGISVTRQEASKLFMDLLAYTYGCFFSKHFDSYICRPLSNPHADPITLEVSSTCYLDTCV